MRRQYNGNQGWKPKVSDEYRKMKLLFGYSMKDRMEQNCKWPCGVCKKESAIIRFCATAARNGPINDVVE